MENSDEQIRSILASMRTIAVIGLSRDPDKDSHRVAAYLQGNLYRIIPVNPNVEEILGEKCYWSLKEVPGKVDVVLVFRPSEFVGKIVDEAIAVDARAVWMQEGISDPVSAVAAREAGLEVVMDRCIMKEHKRLGIDNFL